MDRKEQLRNPAFGGWSEDVLSADDLRRALDHVDTAAFFCGGVQVWDDALREALDHIAETLDKGDSLRSAFVRALDIRNPVTRSAEARRVAGRMRGRVNGR